VKEKKAKKSFGALIKASVSNASFVIRNDYDFKDMASLLDVDNHMTLYTVVGGVLHWHQPESWVEFRRALTQVLLAPLHGSAYMKTVCYASGIKRKVLEFICDSFSEQLNGELVVHVACYPRLVLTHIFPSTYAAGYHKWVVIELEKTIDDEG
jgi:hypothetical protein